ncbi:unknown [Sutterella sp. CAG:521]|nr:unknown [Sutterella sp. CAG:521]
MEGDEIHHVDASHFSNERVVGRTRREIRTDRTTHHCSSGSGGFDTGTQHHRDQRRTHGSSTTGCRRNSDVNEEGHSRADRDQEDAQTADRSGQIVNETAVTLGVICNECKTH